MDTIFIQKAVQERFPGELIEAAEGWIVLKKDQLSSIIRFLKDGPMAFISLHCITAVDRKDSIEMVYHLYSFEQQCMITLKVLLPNADLKIDSLTSLWPAANWLEREVYDLFGVRFLNHPDLRRILNPDSWTEYPLRKDFKRDGFIPRPGK